MDAVAFDREAKRRRRERQGRHLVLDDLRVRPHIGTVVAVIPTMIPNRIEGIEDEMLVLHLDTGRNLPLGDRNREAAIEGWGSKTDAWIGRPVAVCAEVRPTPQHGARRVDHHPRGRTGGQGEPGAPHRGRPEKCLVTDADEVHRLFLDVLSHLVALDDGAGGAFWETVSATLGIPAQTPRDIPPDAYSTVLRLAASGEIPR